MGKEYRMLISLVVAAPMIKWMAYDREFGHSDSWMLARDKVERQIGSDWFHRVKAGDVTVRAIKHGSPYWAEIALTFDDGPHGEETRELLDLLDQYNIKATFFVVGKMVQDRKVLTKEIFDRGHEIGNHSFSHANLRETGLEEILTEYKATNLLVEKVTGSVPRYCRPPGGQMDAKVLKAASALGLSTVYWDNNPGDYKFDDSAEILSRLRLRRQNGSIILLHSGLAPTIEALRTFIPESMKLGYRFVKIDRWDHPEEQERAELSVPSVS